MSIVSAKTVRFSLPFVRTMSFSSVFVEKFDYSSLAVLSISGDRLTAGKSAFASCEHLTTVTIDFQTLEMDTHAFGGCDDLESVIICDNGRSDSQIELGDHAFAYSEKLQSVTIGSGSIRIGDYSFGGCADNLAITIAGTAYTEKMTQDGVESLRRNIPVPSSLPPPPASRDGGIYQEYE